MDSRDDKNLLQSIATFLVGLGLGRSMEQRREGKKRHPILITVLVIFAALIILSPKPSTPKKTYSKISWPDSELASLIPIPSFKVGYLDHESETLIDINVKVKKKDFVSYVESCREKGFTVDYFRDDDSYRADDAFGNYLRVSYDTDEQVMSIWLSKASEPDENDQSSSESDTSVEIQSTPSVPTLTSTQAMAPLSSADCSYKNYMEICTQFEQAGFTNVQTEVLEDLITGWLIDDGDIKQVAIGEQTTFEKGDIFDKSALVLITYHTFPPKTDSSVTSQDDVVSDEILTIENCEELSDALFSEAVWSSFASENEGKTVRFDGNIGARDASHILINTGDFNPDSAPGPCFRIKRDDSIQLPPIGVGDNCVVTAKVGSYDNNAGTWNLTLISMEARGEPNGIVITDEDIDRWIGKIP